MIIILSKYVSATTINCAVFSFSLLAQVVVPARPPRRRLTPAGPAAAARLDPRVGGAPAGPRSSPVRTSPRWHRTAIGRGRT